MTPKQIQGYRNNLKGSVNSCTNGSTVELDLTTARKLVEVIDVLQARATEAEAYAERLAAYLRWQIKEGGTFHPTALSALAAHTQRVNAKEDIQ